MHLLSVPPGLLPRAWPVLGGLVARACDRRGCDQTEMSLLMACLAREATLIAILDDCGAPVAAGVTQVREHGDGRRSCWILALGGSRARDWLGTLSQIEAGARTVHCETVEFVGRQGWERMLPGYAARACEMGTHFCKHLR